MRLTRLSRTQRALLAIATIASLSAVVACRGDSESRSEAAPLPSEVADVVTKPSATPSTAPPSAAGGPGGAADKVAVQSTQSKRAAVSDADLPPALGVQFHGTWSMYYSPSSSATPNAMFRRHLDVLEEQGVALIRVDIGWSASQPENETPSLSNTYNKRISLVLDEAAKRGMKVLATVHQSPAWARPDTGSSVKQYPTKPDSIRPWTTWMAKTFGAKVTAWEVWNEPNLSEFTGVAKVADRGPRYVPVLKAAAAGLRAGDPAARVVFGGPAQTDDGFIAAAYKAGAQPYFDVMSLHPYQGNQTKPPESTDITGKPRMTNLPAVLDVMAANGDSDKPVWWTEFGFSVHSNEDVPKQKVWLLGVPTDDVSGDYLRRAFELARTRYPQVKVAILYTAYKGASDSMGHQYGYRLLEADGQPLAQLPIVSDYLAQFEGHRALS